MSPDDGAAYRFVPGDSDVLIVIFGGILSGFAETPVFEFGRTSRDLPWDRLMIRDLRQAWYLRGLPGHGDDLSAVVDLVRSHVQQRRPRRVVLVGNSAGGYAALAVGAAIDADHVLAFVPQTTITRRHRFWMRDRRWPVPIRALGRRVRRHADLRRIKSGWRHAEIHFPAQHRLDATHAKRMVGRGIHLVPHATDHHRLAADLAKNGDLERMVRAACRVGAQHP